MIQTIIFLILWNNSGCIYIVKSYKLSNYYCSSQYVRVSISNKYELFKYSFRYLCQGRTINMIYCLNSWHLFCYQHLITDSDDINHACRESSGVDTHYIWLRSLFLHLITRLRSLMDHLSGHDMKPSCVDEAKVDVSYF